MFLRASFMLLGCAGLVLPAQAVEASEEMGPLVFRRGETMVVTAVAYSSDVEQTDATPLVTASGKVAGQRTVAANFLPLGTKIRIGQQIYTVEDRLNARYGEARIIDLWQPSANEALEFGVKKLEIEVLALPR